MRLHADIDVTLHADGTLSLRVSEYSADGAVAAHLGQLTDSATRFNNDQVCTDSSRSGVSVARQQQAESAEQDRQRADARLASNLRFGDHSLPRSCTPAVAGRM
jgi:hypothetical protein